MNMKKSYFESGVLSEKAHKLRAANQCPSWLPKALEELEKAKDVFPREEETDRYTVEYIYPH
jgi:hypothetical protein